MSSQILCITILFLRMNIKGKWDRLCRLQGDLEFLQVHSYTKSPKLKKKIYQTPSKQKIIPGNI